MTTPLILVEGSVRILFVGLPGRSDDYAALQRAVDSARHASPLATLGGLLIVEPS